MPLDMIDFRGDRHLMFLLALDAQRVFAQYLSAQEKPALLSIESPNVKVPALVLPLHRMDRTHALRYQR